MNWRYALLAIFLIAAPAAAQTTSGNTYFFPIFADGTSSGTTYKSTVRILPTATTSTPMTCTVSQTQTGTPFVGINGTTYPPIIVNTYQSETASTPVFLGTYQPLEVLQSTAQETLRTGYASVSCPQAVHTEVRISQYDANGNKIGETSVEPATSGISNQFLLDTRDGTRLGLSIVNDSAIYGNYQVIARDEFGHIEAGPVFQPINPYSQVSIFADQAFANLNGTGGGLPANFFGTIEVIGVTGSTTYAVGLQYTGPVFSLVTPTVRNAPIGGSF